MKTKALAIISAILISNAININAYANDATSSNASSKGIFTFLAPMLFETLKQVVVGVVQQGSNTIFQKLNSLGQSTTSTNQTSSGNNQQSQMQQTIQPQQAQTLAQQPLVALTVTKYANKNINSQIIEVVNFPANGDVSFSINTGEAFAVKFDTSVPGRVRIINIDAYGKMDGPWDYDVIGTAENRLPRTNNIEMVGAAGQENLEIQFTPCVPQAKATDPRVAQYINILPSCSVVNQSNNYQPKSMHRVIKSKGMSNEEANLNPGVVLMAASPDLPIGTAQTFRLRVNHMSPYSYQNPANQQAVPGV